MTVPHVTTASEHMRDALTILAIEGQNILAGGGRVEPTLAHALGEVALRIERALPMVEATERQLAGFEATGIVHVEIDWARDRFSVVQRYRTVVLDTGAYSHALEVARALRATLGGAPDIPICTQRPTLIAARGD